MKLLLDTHVLLSAAARALLEDPDNELLYSSAILWEIAIKRGLGRDDFQVDVRLLRRGLLDNGYHELAITGAHAVAVDGLPPIHKDRPYPGRPIDGRGHPAPHRRPPGRPIPCFGAARVNGFEVCG